MSNQNIRDVLALTSLLILTALFAARYVNFNTCPFEDAAMLMRYADHLAQGSGIVWNIGEHPVDGATDFLFMAVVALVRRFGVSIEAAVRVITVPSHFATVALIYAGMRRVQGSGVIAAWLSAAYFAFGPGLLLAAAYFGTPFFALAVAIAWLLAQRLIFRDGEVFFGAIAFSLCSLAVGLIRPEGVLMAALMLVAVGLAVPFKSFRKIVIVFAMVFAILGGSYLAWRWNYFGHLLPNPFYKKGGGHLYLSGLKDSIRGSFALMFPFLPAFLLALRDARSRQLGIAFLVPIVGSVGMWVLLSSEMNFAFRFQYPILGICVLSWYPLVRRLRDDMHRQDFTAPTRLRKLAGVTAAMALAWVFHRHVSNSVVHTYSTDGRYDVALMLSRYADRGYTIATTEAGLLPLYSRWRAIDTWGLNDPWIAHHGAITEQYLREQHPDIVMWHGYFSPVHPVSADLDLSSWSAHVRTLQRFVQTGNFTLAAVYGTAPQDTHYYYVRRDLPDHDAIVQSIRSMDYAWCSSGEKSRNYAPVTP